MPVSHASWVKTLAEEALSTATTVDHANLDPQRPQDAAGNVFGT